MSVIVVTSQQKLDSLPHDYRGRIYIKFGTPYARAVVRRKYDFASVVARGNSSVVALGNSSVVAFGNSAVAAFENSSVVAWDNSSVEACGNSQISQKSDTSKIKTSGNARIVREMEE